MSPHFKEDSVLLRVQVPAPGPLPLSAACQAGDSDDSATTLGFCLLIYRTGGMVFVSPDAGWVVNAGDAALPQCPAHRKYSINVNTTYSSPSGPWFTRRSGWMMKEVQKALSHCALGEAPPPPQPRAWTLPSSEQTWEEVWLQQEPRDPEWWKGLEVRMEARTCYAAHQLWGPSRAPRPDFPSRQMEG